MNSSSTTQRKRLRKWKTRNRPIVPKTKKSKSIPEGVEHTPDNSAKQQEHEPGRAIPCNNPSQYAGLLCPIFKILPLNPVLAPDNHVYEKDAYENYLKFPTKDQFGRILSPLTRKPMEKPNSHIAHDYTIRLIHSFIDTGIINGTDAIKWKDAREMQQRIKDTIKNPNANEKYIIGELFYYGDSDYFQVDYDKAIRFYRLARDFGSVEGEAMFAICKLEGHGTPKDVLLGSNLLLNAAHRGSVLAAYRASLLFSNNQYTFGNNQYTEDEYKMRDFALEVQFLKMAITHYEMSGINLRRTACTRSGAPHLLNGFFQDAQSRLNRLLYEEEPTNEDDSIIDLSHTEDV